MYEGFIQWRLFGISISRNARLKKKKSFKEFQIGWANKIVINSSLWWIKIKQDRWPLISYKNYKGSNIKMFISKKSLWSYVKENISTEMALKNSF